MPGVVRPPYGAPTGPLVSDAQLAAAYLAGARTGHSPTLHIEEDVLLAGRFEAVALRLGVETLIVRTDVACRPLAEALEGRLRLVAREPPLATVVALQALGHSAAPWELWGADGDDAARLLAAAVEI